MPYKSHIHRAQVKVAVASGRLDPAVMHQLDAESRGLRLPTSHFPTKRKRTNVWTWKRRRTAPPPREA